MQEQVAELQKQLDLARSNLQEVCSDRDMFLRRLQQLELEGRDGSEGGSSGGSSMLELQRQKAHAAQVGLKGRPAAAGGCCCGTMMHWHICAPAYGFAGAGL
jgi:hypothetical protein